MAALSRAWLISLLSASMPSRRLSHSTSTFITIGERYSGAHEGMISSFLFTHCGLNALFVFGRVYMAGTDPRRWEGLLRSGWFILAAESMAQEYKVFVIQDRTLCLRVTRSVTQQQMRICFCIFYFLPDITWSLTVIDRLWGVIWTLLE